VGLTKRTTLEHAALSVVCSVKKPSLQSFFPQSPCGAHAVTLTFRTVYAIFFTNLLAYLLTYFSEWQHTHTVLRQLRTVRRQVPTSVFQSLIVALVLSRLDYCNSVQFGLPANLIQRLQSVQNAAARLIFRIRRSDTPALISLH